MPLKSKQKASLVILFLILFLGGFGGHYYASRYAPDPESAVPKAPIDEQSSILKFNNVDLDTSTIQSSGFDGQKLYGPNPIRAGLVGKHNIFR